MRTVCVAIPTYRREQVLVDTVRQVLAQDPPPDEVLVVDQSSDHQPSTLAALEAWRKEHKIRWIKHSPPNLPGARNRCLLEAKSEIVVFIDDDVVLAPGFVQSHRRCYDDPGVDAVAGQVLQQNQQVYTGAVKDHELRFPFNYDKRAWVRAIPGGNHSVRRSFALALGGFDERFVRGAYREESDFARRAVVRSGREILFEPEASLVHLGVATGGCRSWKCRPNLFYVGGAVGNYYYALKNLAPMSAIRYIVGYVAVNIGNRYCRRHPWVIPMQFLGCTVGLLWALWLAVRGRKLISHFQLCESGAARSCRADSG